MPLLALWLVGCPSATTISPAPADAPFRLTAAGKVPQVTSIQSSAGDPDALYVVEQEGRVWRLAGGQQRIVLDLTDRVDAGGEKGLLGLALSPRWPTDPHLWVNYTHSAGGQLRTRIARFTVDPATWRGDPASEQEVIGWDQPYANHNSGPVLFAPDGTLFVTVGDGGSGGDPQGRAQDPGQLLGKILRLDVSVAPYRVPPDNPFVGREGWRPEIWALGVRNPWGASFDGDTLWFADVGQNQWEEVDQGKKGANYGWNVLEGTHCFKAATCDTTGMTPPLAEYGHDVGQSITGGLLYRGPSIPALDGRYLYADFVSGAFFGLKPGAAPEALPRLSMNPSAFGVDTKNRLYIADYSTGVLWRVDP